MTVITKATPIDIELLANIGKTTFIESHGSSASAADINSYVSKRYSEDAVKAELSNSDNLYHIIYHQGIAVGYSKMIFNQPYPTIEIKQVTKLERIYLLKEFYSLQLGYTLLNFNIELSKQHHQAGMWLFVWTENHRAVSFYKKTGFEIIGSHDFKLTETHSNPNYQMLLKY